MLKKKIYDKWTKKMKLQKIINASGRMTALGVSTISNNVLTAITFGSQNYVNFKDLISKSGQIVAELTKTEAGYVVNSTAAGIVQTVAGLIHKGDLKYVYSPHKAVSEDKVANEIVLPKGHNIDFGTSIQTLVELAGGKLIEAGWANACNSQNIESLINKNTIALMYVISHHCVQKSILDFKEMNKIAKKYKIPLIIDIASESEIKKYVDEDIDIMILSGSKNLEGPTSGFVFGKKEILKNIILEHYGLGRSMKIDKALIFGALVALDDFLKNDKRMNDQLLQNIKNGISNISNIVVDYETTNEKRNFKRLKIQFLKSSKITISEFVNSLEKGDVGIYTRKHRLNEGIIYIDGRPLMKGDDEIIINKINQIIDSK